MYFMIVLVSDGGSLLSVVLSDFLELCFVVWVNWFLIMLWIVVVGSVLFCVLVCGEFVGLLFFRM